MIKSLKKMWALVLSASVLIATLSAIPMVAYAADESVWDGSSVDTGWYGDGSADTFEISTAEEFAGLIELTCNSSGSNFAGKTINLTNDINLDNKNWTPLGTAKQFAGVLDGNNHTIKNVVITTTEVPYHGLFMATNGATIQNLTIENFRDSNSMISGAFVAFAMRTTLKNCTAKNCNFNTTTYYCGGLVGNSSRYLKVYNSSFIDGSVNAGYYAGGIVGNQQSDEGSEFKHIMVDPGEGGHIKGAYYVGGVTGYTKRTTTSTASYEDCITYGDIISNGVVYGVGGILGFDDSSSISYKLSMKNCVSFADINVNLTSYNDIISVGGIIGSMQPVPDVDSLYASLDYCDFFGTISTSGSGAIKSGGITGWVSYILQNCANFGEIKGDRVTWAGGITGASTRDRMNILNSYNAGTVNPDSGDSIGAFSGYHGYSNAEKDINLFLISNAYNVGKIKHTDTLVTEKAIGLQFWGTLDRVYWLYSGNNQIYDSIDNTYQEASRLSNLGQFYGSDLDVSKTPSSLVYNLDVNMNSRPFLSSEGTSTDKNLLDTLNDEADAKSPYLHWVVYPEDDIAGSVTAETAIPEKVEAFAKVKDYKYPMLAHTSTVRYASEEDAEMGSPVIISAAVDNDDTKVYDAAYRTVVVDPRPEGSNTVRSITVTDGYGREVEVRDNGDGTYSYTMPRTDAIVTVAYENNYEFLDKVTLTKTYRNKENYTNAGQILNPQGVLEENITFSIAPYTAFNREEGRLSVAIPSFSDASYTISAGDGTDLVDVDLPDYTDAGIGDYWYEVNETAGTAAGVTYDVNTYYMHVVVSREGRNHGVSQVTLHKTAPSNDGTYTNDADDKTAGFTNTFGSGSLTVTKEIIGNFADRDKKFDITVTLTVPTGKTVTGPIAYGTETIAGGWTGSKAITLQLGKGDSVTFTNIPDGVTYTVDEADYSSDGYDIPQYVFDNDSETGDTVLTGTAWEENYASGTISDSADAVTVTNSKNAAIDVGVVLENAPYVIIILMVIGFGIFMIVRRRRRIDE